MNPQTENILLIAGFFVITVLSFIIEIRVRKQLSAQMSIYTYAIVGMVCFYYFVDVLVHAETYLRDKYFYFWLLLLLVQTAIFIVRLKTVKEGNELH